MLGFTTSRTLDPSSGQDARGELNAALSRRMAELEKKKRLANQKEKFQVCDKLRDDVRTLHEAYQFLSRKYILAQQRAEARKKEEAENCSDDDDDDDEVEAGVYEEDEDVFVDFGKMQRTNSNKRRPSAVPAAGPAGGIAGAMAMAANSMATKV